VICAARHRFVRTLGASSILGRGIGFGAFALVALALASPAAACVCADAPLDERLDGADAAAVARFVEERSASASSGRVLVFDVEQRVKGDVGGTIDVRSPSGTDCDLEVQEGQSIGLLLTRMPSGEWLGTACSVVAPGELVAEGGEPRGGPIKVAIGIAILALVLLFARYRLRKGSRPELPGAPEP
jgi:hypothetical protein